MGKISKIITCFSIIFCLVICTYNARAQSNVSLKYFGVSVHPLGDDLAALERYKLDSKGYVVLNLGGYAEYEHFIWQDFLSVNAGLGIFSDCSNGMAGLAHIGLRGLAKEYGHHRLYLDLGPALYIRRDWNRFPEYEDNGAFNRTKMNGVYWQYRFFPIAGMLEYDYDISNNKTLSFNIIPLPVIAIGFGLKYWFNKNFKIPKKLLVPEN